MDAIRIETDNSFEEQVKSITNINDLMKFYDKSFHSLQPEGMRAVKAECKRRGIDFWACYTGYVMSFEE